MLEYAEELVPNEVDGNEELTPTAHGEVSIEVDGVKKQFRDVHAVRDLSFRVHRHEIFGLLGPNGAGKTTTIRMLMRMLLPDEGQIRLFGDPINDADRERFGYLPEERGLYAEQPVLDNLVYLARLKGSPRRRAKQVALEWLDRVGLADVAKRKANTLSKGMQQKVQFIMAIQHDPDIVILDEPFTGLDPVNLTLIKDLVGELRDQGKTIILSTHQMHQVELLADKILLISKGQKVLYGSLLELRRQFSPNSVHIEVAGELPHLSGVRTERTSDGLRVHLEAGTDPAGLLRQLVERGVPVRSFEVEDPRLADIFVEAVGEDFQGQQI
jgi:ABC-2 type transport system ATP-binding protein